MFFFFFFFFFFAQTSGSSDYFGLSKECDVYIINKNSSVYPIWREFFFLI